MAADTSDWCSEPPDPNAWWFERLQKQAFCGLSELAGATVGEAGETVRTVSGEAGTTVRGVAAEAGDTVQATAPLAALGAGIGVSTYAVVFVALPLAAAGADLAFNQGRGLRAVGRLVSSIL